MGVNCANREICDYYKNWVEVTGKYIPNIIKINPKGFECLARTALSDLETGIHILDKYKQKIGRGYEDPCSIELNLNKQYGFTKSSKLERK